MSDDDIDRDKSDKSDNDDNKSDRGGDDDGDNDNEKTEEKEKEVEEPIPERRIAVEIPKISVDLGSDLHFVKLPNFLSVETRPYDRETYEDEIDEEETLDEEGRARYVDKNIFILIILLLYDTIEWVIYYIKYIIKLMVVILQFEFFFKIHKKKLII